MCKIRIVPYFPESPEWLEFLKRQLAELFALPVEIGNPGALPEESENSRRGQVLASAVLADLCSVEHTPGNILLGLVNRDLYEKGLNFVFGLATPVHRCALVATPRLHNSFYGLPEERELFLRRLLTEAVHEIGHTLGLEHCPDPHCVMHFSNTLADTDRKGYRFCPRCRARVEEALAPCRR